MKFTKSILKDKDLSERIFKSSLLKAKNLLADIFQIDFNAHDSRIKYVIDKTEKLYYGVVIEVNGRKIKVHFGFEVGNDGLLNEVLRIKETEIINIPISTSKSDFKHIVNKIMSILEAMYDINFTPLNPDEEDNHIKKIVSIEVENTWIAFYTTDDHEASFKAEYKASDNLKQPTLKITQYNNHSLYFE